MDIDDIYKCTIEAAQEAFDEPIKRQKRKDCDYRLKPILEKRRKALEENDHEQFKKITKELKKKARSIKLENNLRELRDNNWDPIKTHKKGYLPKHTKLKDINGNQVHDRLRAETFAVSMSGLSVWSSAQCLFS